MYNDTVYLNVSTYLLDCRQLLFVDVAQLDALHLTQIKICQPPPAHCQSNIIHVHAMKYTVKKVINSFFLTQKFDQL